MLQIENSTERQPCDAFKFKTRERTFLSEPWPLFQGEAKSEAIDRNLFHSHANKIHFHKKKGFALSLSLKMKMFGTQKWPITSFYWISPPRKH